MKLFSSALAFASISPLNSSQRCFLLPRKNQNPPRGFVKVRNALFLWTICRYGITSEQDIQVEQLEESNEQLADMKKEAEQYHLGVTFTGYNPAYGTLLSPFKLSSSAGEKVVSITMNKPDREMEDLDDPQYYGFKIAVQNTTDGALVHFFPAEIDTEKSTVTAEIPLTNGSPDLCALVSYQIGDEPLKDSQFESPESILENSDGSVVQFTWKFQVAQPELNGGVFGGTYNNISKSEIRLDLGSLRLESSSVKLTAEGEPWKAFDIGEIKETADGSGVWIIKLTKPENVENNTYINTLDGYGKVTLSFDTVLSHEDSVEGVQSPIIAELGVAHYVDAANSGGPAILGMAQIDKLSVTPAVTVTPADLTIYQGGDGEPVNVMATLGIVEGVGDDKFEPDREITRAEFTAMAMRFAQGETGGKNIFSDVDEDDWFYDVVVDSIKYGWIEGYPDGTFRPQNLITREEVTTIVNRMLGRLPDEDYIDAHEDDLDLFPDVTKNWAYYDVVEATNDHEYTKTSSGEDWTKLG